MFTNLGVTGGNVDRDTGIHIVEIRRPQPRAYVRQASKRVDVEWQARVRRSDQEKDALQERRLSARVVTDEQIHSAETIDLQVGDGTEVLYSHALEHSSTSASQGKLASRTILGAKSHSIQDTAPAIIGQPRYA